MRSLEALERAIDVAPDPAQAAEEALRLLGLAEEVLEAWIVARGGVPSSETREGFRLLALHHEGARGVPSFNACRETCREVAWHFNLLTGAPAQDPARTLCMMQLLVRHLAYFVGGKMQVEGLGEFCCASRPLRQDSGIIAAG
jgi:hypothetical protein